MHFGGLHQRGIFPCPRSSLQLTSECANLLRFQAFRGSVLCSVRTCADSVCWRGDGECRMTTLEDIKNGASVRGIVPGQPVEVVSVEWIGDQAINLVYRVQGVGVAETTLYRDDQVRIEIDVRWRVWSFDADGDLLRLVTEANRIKLAHYFDPHLAIHTSLVDPLPHQISAVYGEMLPRQPLRFLLADDPGAGKTIMAGLLVKELIARSDLGPVDI